MAAVFACENVTKCYAGLPVVENISFALEAREIAALLGPSGVGKTTLFNALSGVDRPDEGRVTFHGRDITGTSGAVAYMLQRDLLFPWRTVLDNVILPLVLAGMKKKAAREEAFSYFAEFGLSGYENKWPRQLSGGEKQRAALLRTCLAKRDVILLDEPFSALDALTRERLRAWFVRIAAEMGFSALLITHDVDEALALADTIYIMNKTGSAAALTAAFTVSAACRRAETFYLTEDYTLLKQQILSNLG